jgi:hypothetical protein
MDAVGAARDSLSLESERFARWIRAGEFLPPHVRWRFSRMMNPVIHGLVVTVEAVVQLAMDYLIPLMVSGLTAGLVIGFLLGAGVMLAETDYSVVPDEREARDGGPLPESDDCSTCGGETYYQIGGGPTLEGYCPECEKWRLLRN